MSVLDRLKKHQFEQFIKGIKKPSLFYHEGRQIMTEVQKSVRSPVYESIYKYAQGDGIHVANEDWDNLFILDACRFDIFSEINYLNGELKRVNSKGSGSKEFINKNFNGEKLHNTVYITANGKSYTDLNEGVFHDVIYSYGNEYDNLEHKELTDRRDPEFVADLCKKYYKQHNDKRLICHFMQPHSPYYGKKAKKLRDDLRQKKNIRFSAWDDDNHFDEECNYVFRHLMGAAKYGFISPGELREVYIENLEYVLKYINELVKSVDGKTVITSDHGELLGESSGIFSFARFNHHDDLWIPELRQVPWLVIDSDQRRDIFSDPPVETEQIDKKRIKEHLKDLGYV